MVEMLLTILSSLVQEEVESLSSNVKNRVADENEAWRTGRFQWLLQVALPSRYEDYTVNEKEAETVRMVT